MHAMNRTPQPIHRPRASRRAFTLVELLVVIAIIGMLVAITSVAVMRALGTAKQTAMKSELDQLDLALKNYKEKYGAYPPCFVANSMAALPAIKQHLARAFPRYDQTYLVQDLAAAGINGSALRPDQALVFWLRGFSSDPMHPFVTLDDKLISGGNRTDVTVKRVPLFDFDQTRLIACPVSPGEIVVPSYFPAGLKVQSDPPTDPESPYSILAPGSPGAPYLYWDASRYEASARVLGMPGTDPQPRQFNIPSQRYFANAGVAMPYWNDVRPNGSTCTQMQDENDSWANPESFQLIACGTDGKYGNPNAPASGPWLPRLYPTGTNYDNSPDQADDDNVTNFCDRSRIGDARP